MFEAAYKGESIVDACINVSKDILLMARNKKNKVKMDFFTQQDSHEGLLMLLEALDTIPEVKRLFQHRHRNMIKCSKCQKVVVDKPEDNLVFEVQPDLKSEQHTIFLDQKNNTTSQDLNDFLKKQDSFVDADFICPSCKQKGEKFKATVLTMVPEILPIVLKKYRGKCCTPFPNKLEFTNKSATKKYRYMLIAQSEHSGGMSGGHYWAVCLRQSNNDLAWKLINDREISDGKCGPTINTYIIFYHYLDSVDL
jgi:uncharacterized UBP type Zn finger protein